MENPFGAAWIGPPVRWDAEGRPAGFVDRQSELQAVERGFQSDGRIGLVTGALGMGKTALAHVYASTYNARFPGGVFAGAVGDTDSMDDLLLRPLALPVSSPILIVLDEADRASDADIRRAAQVLKAHERLRLLVVARDAGRWAALADFHVRLDGLAESGFVNMLGVAAINDPEGAARLHELAAGHPVVALVAGNLASGPVAERSLRDVIDHFLDFRQAGVLGPSGEEVSSSEPLPRGIAVEVQGINDRLVRHIRRDPKLLETLSPRQFEELVADLLARQGFRVELTPASKDGGFDLYAARRDDLGTFLYLVECKRYTPPNKVGVEVVRSLHGVVQMKKATAGVIATTSSFTRGARGFQESVQYQMSLVDYCGLHRWLEAALGGTEGEGV